MPLFELSSMHDWFLRLFTVYSLKLFGRKIVRCCETQDHWNKFFHFEFKEGDIYILKIPPYHPIYEMEINEAQKFILLSVRDYVFSSLPRLDRLIREQHFGEGILLSFGIKI